MEKVDVYVWMDDEDYAVASSSLRSLKKHVSANIGDWFVVGKRGEKLERLGYDLGARMMSRPATFSALGELLASNGEAEHLVVWSSFAVLLADWEPWQKEQSRIWATCPCAALLRTELAGWNDSVTTWPQAQSLGSDHHVYLKDSQVKVLPFEEYEKALKGTTWGFGPSVLILETGTPAR